jgi:hypothetical protein
MKHLIVANPSLGDALSYTFPLAVHFGKSGLFSPNENVTKILSCTPFFEGDSGDVVVLTGAPGWHRRNFECHRCNFGKCSNCGRDINHYQMIDKLANSEDCIGEWFQRLNLDRFVESNEIYRPKKIIDVWNLKEIKRIINFI